MKTRLYWLQLILLSLLVVMAIIVFTQSANAFHGCEDNEGDCDNSPTVYICIQPDSCKFS
jgi:hypothetical protein